MEYETPDSRDRMFEGPQSCQPTQSFETRWAVSGKAWMERRLTKLYCRLPPSPFWSMWSCLWVKRMNSPSRLSILLYCDNKEWRLQRGPCQIHARSSLPRYQVRWDWPSYSQVLDPGWVHEADPSRFMIPCWLFISDWQWAQWSRERNHAGDGLRSSTAPYGGLLWGICCHGYCYSWWPVQERIFVVQRVRRRFERWVKIHPGKAQTRLKPL